MSFRKISLQWKLLKQLVDHASESWDHCKIATDAANQIADAVHEESSIRQRGGEIQAILWDMQDMFRELFNKAEVLRQDFEYKEPKIEETTPEDIFKKFPE